VIQVPSRGNHWDATLNAHTDVLHKAERELRWSRVRKTIARLERRGDPKDSARLENLLTLRREADQALSRLVGHLTGLLDEARGEVADYDALSPGEQARAVAQGTSDAPPRIQGWVHQLRLGRLDLEASPHKTWKGPAELIRAVERILN
jgi:hypothetical protein